MTKQGQLDRGKKWVGVKELLTLQNRNADVEWMNTQKAIVEDMKAYENSIKPEPTAKKAKEE